MVLPLYKFAFPPFKDASCQVEINAFSLCRYYLA